MADDIPYVLRVEGVNFAATLLDTQDISTIRGAGLALLAVGDIVRTSLESERRIRNVRQLYSGASQAAFCFNAPPEVGEAVRTDIANRLNQTGPDGEPFEHLCFVVDVVCGDAATGLHHAEARNRVRQFRQWTVKLPEFSPASQDPDPFDQTRPASRAVHLPPGKLPGTESSPETEYWLSPSTAERRAFGQSMRHQFYRHEAGEVTSKNLEFTDSFDEIVGGLPESAALPLSLRSAIAVIYADGNSFGSLREAMDFEEFSRQIKQLRRGLLEQILTWYRTGQDDPSQRPRFALTAGSADDSSQRTKQAFLRFETLLWGGDEMMFVMPSWLAVAFVEGIAQATRAWTIDGHKVTHTIGLVICHHKTPIRQARDIAHEIVDTLKGAMRREGNTCNAVGIEVFETLMPPQDGLAAHRHGLFGTPPNDKLTLDLAMPGDVFERLRGQHAAIAQALPRSQLYRALREARRAKDGLASEAASQAAQAVLNDYSRRVRRSDGEALPTLPHLPGVAGRSLALELMLRAMLWDYVCPFQSEPLPGFLPSAAAS